MNFGNMGIALGAGVDEYNNQRKLAREDELLAMQKAADSRQAEQFGWQREAEKRKSKIQTDQDALLRGARANAEFLRELDSLPDDQLGDFAGRVTQHYNQDPAWANGMFANLTNVEGKPYVVHGNMAQLGGVQMIPATREHIRGALGHMNDDLQRRLALAGGAETYLPYAAEQSKLALQRKEVDAKSQYYRDAGEYHRGILNKPVVHSDGLGRVVALSSDGTQLLGTYGSPRPDPASAQVALTNRILADNRALDSKYAPLFDAAEKAVTDAYATNDPTKIRAAQASAQMLNNAYLRERATKNPTAGGLQLHLPTEPNSKASTPIEAEVPTADGKGMVKVKTTMAEAVANGWIAPPIPVTQRADPRSRPSAASVPAYAEDAPTQTLDELIQASGSGTPSARSGVAPGGFYGSRPRFTSPGQSPGTPNPFVPGTGLSLRDITAR